MKTNEKLINWLKICEVKGLGPKKILKLLSLFQNIEDLFSASATTLLKTRIFNESMLESWQNLQKNSDDKYKDILKTCNDNNIDIIPLYHSDYPLQLKLLPDSPYTLYVKGDKSLLKDKKIAIVGSRKSDSESRIWTHSTSEEFVKKGITIVSGGAFGIDFEAHSGALTNEGRTICVLGSGLLNLYPQEHEQLFKEISKRGLLISEHPPHFRGGRISLLARNRITSGLSDAILVVTTTSGGGSMTQTKIAHSQKIPIFCPKLDFNFSPNVGIREIIKEYDGMEIESIEPILEKINEDKPSFLQIPLL